MRWGVCSTVMDRRSSGAARWTIAAVGLLVGAMNGVVIFQGLLADDLFMQILWFGGSLVGLGVLTRAWIVARDEWVSVETDRVLWSLVWTDTTEGEVSLSGVEKLVVVREPNELSESPGMVWIRLEGSGKEWTIYSPCGDIENLLSTLRERCPDLPVEEVVEKSRVVLDRLMGK